MTIPFGKRRRHGKTFIVAALTLALIGGACGSSGSSAKATPDNPEQSTIPGSGNTKSKSKGANTMPNPCELVTNAFVSELLGGPATKPKVATVGPGSQACNWQLQETVDNADPSTIGHMIELVVVAPPNKSLTPEQYFEMSQKSAPMTKADVCEKSFWRDNGLRALQNGVYLSTTAGFGSDDPAAKAAQEKLMAAACKAVA